MIFHNRVTLLKVTGKQRCSTIKNTLNCVRTYNLTIATHLTLLNGLPLESLIKNKKENCVNKGLFGSQS